MEGMSDRPESRVLESPLPRVPPPFLDSVTTLGSIPVFPPAGFRFFGFRRNTGRYHRALHQDRCVAAGPSTKPTSVRASGFTPGVRLSACGTVCVCARDRDRRPHRACHDAVSSLQHWRRRFVANHTATTDMLSCIVQDVIFNLHYVCSDLLKESPLVSTDPPQQAASAL